MTRTLLFTRIFQLSLLLVFNISLAQPTECNDGIDNDGDGLIDWQYDLGCYDSTDNSERGAYSRVNLNGNAPIVDIGPYNNRTENGWTTIDPSTNSRIVYVSSSTGNDTSDGLTPSTAVKTIAQGYSLLRDSMPDWLLLKRGDTWESEFLGPTGQWYKNGLSHHEKMVVASYGSSTQRPLLIDGKWRNRNTGVALNYLAIMGIEFYARMHDPASAQYSSVLAHSSIDRLVPGEGFLLEDLRLRFSGMLMDMPSQGIGNVTIRRCIVTDSFSDTSGHAQGTFLKGATDSTLIEETIYDANGWYSPDGDGGIGPTSWFNHNFYIKEAKGFIYRNNINTRTSGGGVKLSSDHYRAFDDFIVDNNLFVGGDGAMGLNQSGGIQDSTPSHYNFSLTNNVITRMGRTYIKNGNANRANGIRIYTGEKGTINNNYFVHKDFTLAQDGVVTLGNNQGWIIQDISVSDNIIFDWYDSNPFKQTGGPQVTYTNNIVNADSGFVDTTRSVETYMAYLGKPATLDTFYSEIRKQAKFNWRDEYTAQKANCFIKAGFCRQNELAKAGFTYAINNMQVSFTDTSKNIDTTNTCFTPIEWDFGDGIKSTQRNPVHTYSAPGIYLVKQTVGNSCGTDTSAQNIIITTAGIQEDISDHIHIYPNPTDAVVTISGLQTFQGEKINISVFNVLGKKVYEQLFELYNIKKLNLDMKTLHITPGMYFVNIQGVNQYLTKRIILTEAQQ